MNGLRNELEGVPALLEGNYVLFGKGQQVAVLSMEQFYKELVGYL